MTSARPIGELLAPILARAQAMIGFQALLAACPHATARKSLIMSARECGAIEPDDAELLIQAYQLETA